MKESFKSRFDKFTFECRICPYNFIYKDRSNAFKKRLYAAIFLKAAFPRYSHSGPRQSGKTTLAQTTLNHHAYVSLEDPDLRAAAAYDPRTFLLANRNDSGVIIDEFQYVPTLLSYIQTMVDQGQKPGYFILTGSQNSDESGDFPIAGWAHFYSHTFTTFCPELADNDLMPSEIEPLLYKGSYPAIYAKNIEPDRLYKTMFKHMLNAMCANSLM